LVGLTFETQRLTFKKNGLIIRCCYLVPVGVDVVDKLKIEMLKVSEVVEYENNAKLHPDYQIRQIANSIEKFGFNDPIAIDQNNIIIEGHGRLKAALLLGLEKVPVIRIEHLSEAEKRAYIIAHNKLNTSTGYDEEILAREINNLCEDSFDFFSELGMSNNEIFSEIDKISDDVDDEINGDKRDSDDIVNEADERGEVNKIKSEKKAVRFADIHYLKAKHAKDLGVIPSKKEQIRCITQGCFNMYSILVAISQMFEDPVEELYLSTFSIKGNVIVGLFQMLEAGIVQKMRLIIAATMVNRTPKRIQQIRELSAMFRDKYDVQTKLTENHSKIMLIKSGENFYCLEGSGNLSDNAQIEQYSISNSEEVYNFHKKWMDSQHQKNIGKREEIF